MIMTDSDQVNQLPLGSLWSKMGQENIPRNNTNNLTVITLLVLRSLLTELLHHKISWGRVVKTVCKVCAVPHQQLLVSRDGLHCVEEDVHAVLASSQVLLLLWVSWVHVAHPVAFFLIQAIYKVMELSFCINLRESEVLIIKHGRSFHLTSFLSSSNMVTALEANRQTSGRC